MLIFFCCSVCVDCSADVLSVVSFFNETLLVHAEGWLPGEDKVYACRADCQKVIVFTNVIHGLKVGKFEMMLLGAALPP